MWLQYNKHRVAQRCCSFTLPPVQLVRAACCHVLLASSSPSPAVGKPISILLPPGFSPSRSHFPGFLQENFSQACCCWKSCHVQSCDLPTPPAPSSLRHRHSLPCCVLSAPGHTAEALHRLVVGKVICKGICVVEIVLICWERGKQRAGLTSRAQMRLKPHGRISHLIYQISLHL